MLALHSSHSMYYFVFFFFMDTATTEIYTLSLHDALPISSAILPAGWPGREPLNTPKAGYILHLRSEEHTSELQSRCYLVCRLLLEKKKNTSAGIATSPQARVRIGSVRAASPR